MLWQTQAAVNRKNKEIMRTGDEERLVLNMTNAVSERGKEYG